MSVYKLLALLLVAVLVLPTVCTVRGEASEVASDEPSAGLEEQAFKLLRELARETSQLGAPENRVRASTIVGDLLWGRDERAAREIFQNALGELQNLFAAINLPNVAEMNRSERADHFLKRDALAELRRDYVKSLGAHDPAAALAALDALKIRTIDEYDPLDATELELQLTSVIALKDPKKSYSVAKAQFDAGGLTYQFVQALKELHRKDSQLASSLGRDVLAQIKSGKLRVPTNTASNSNQTKPKNELDFWQICSFIESAAEINRVAARDKEKKALPLLSDTEMKEAVETVGNAFLATPNATETSISQVMPQITRYAPALAQRIQLKIGAAASRQLDRIVESQNYYAGRNEKSADQLAKEAEMAAPDVREQRMADAATKALEENDAEKAQSIAARLKNRRDYDYLFEQIKEALPLAKARRGDVAEVRKMLAALKSEKERVKVLIELASAIAAKGDKETAKKLLDESAQIAPAILKNYADVEIALKFADVYAVAAPERSFAILENGIAQTDDYINAGVKLDEFYMVSSTAENELLFSAINRQFLMHVPNSVSLIKNLAAADFARTVGLADKFQRPEVRLFARLRIASALLDAEAAEKEKTMRDELAADGETE